MACCNATSQHQLSKRNDETMRRGGPSARSGSATSTSRRAYKDPGNRYSHGGRQRVDVVGAVVPPAVDEERRRAGDTAHVGRVYIGGDFPLPGPLAHIMHELVSVKTNIGRVPHEVHGGQRILVMQQLVQHLPELALVRCSL